jgi:leader peptidase (prepilin peptidase) / N-methyltransferase
MFWVLILAGFMVGVLINLCADSLPTARRLHRPSCATCGRPRSAIRWSSVIASLSRRRRCPHCNALQSARHILVELVVPLLFVLCWVQSGTGVTMSLHLVYSALFVLITVIDMEHRLILHVVSLPAILLAVVGAYVDPIFDSPKRALLGGAIGLVAALILYFSGMLFSWLVGRARGQPLPGPAFGFGDVTLSTFLGLILGAPEIIFALVIGILAGFVGAILYLLIRGLIQREHQIFTAFMPYGPFLVLGAAIMLYFGQAFMAWYTRG